MFFLEQFEGKYRIYYDGKFTIKDSGSYNVLGARILGLSYGDYLRFLVQNGATVIGKKSKYTSFFFKSLNALSCVNIAIKLLSLSYISS